MDVMEALPAQIAMQMAITQQRAAVSMIKQTADMQKQVADLLTASVSGRGNAVNLSV